MPFQFDPMMFKRFEGQVRLAEGMAMDIAEEAAHAFAETAERVMREEFLAATTKTGLSGKPAGRKGPGRYNTGKLVAAIMHEVEVGGREAIGRAGFLRDQEPYYLYQDRGTKSVPAAHAMQKAFIEGREAAIKVIRQRWSSR